jgi:coenzyme F420-reducing hydrogenase beta subunit
MTIETIGKECCGCRNCISVCPTKAISMAPDKYQFEYPKVNATLCIKCGACKDACPICNSINKTVPEVYLCGVSYSLDENTKKGGSSGGLFGALAKAIIVEGGVVFGAAFDSNLKLKTTMATTFAELEPLCKSKYLLCDTTDMFNQIEKLAKSGIKVLYCSSPCQIAALKLYLHRDYENLFTIEFICHGVGSQYLFDRSITYSQKKLNAKINNVVFRYKPAHASSHYYYFYLQKGSRSYGMNDLYLSFPYYNAYCKQLVCRDACYSCKFADKKRNSDVTIGDFHRIEKYNRNIDRLAGVSMFLCNSKKGERLFMMVKGDLFVEEMPPNILYENNRFSSDGSCPPNRQKFLESIVSDPFYVTIHRFLRPIKDLKRLIYYKSPAFVRNIARRLIGE